MRTVLSLLWTALFLEAAIVDARPAAFSSNFDACVLWAKEHIADANVIKDSSYSAYKCEGATAERLFVVPDACFGDSKLKSDNISIARRQDDGTYIRVSWESDTSKCGGQCDVRLSVVDDKLNYSCQVHKSAEDQGRTTVGQAGLSLSLDDRVKDLENRMRRIEDGIDSIKDSLKTRTSRLETDLVSVPKRTPTYSPVPHHRRISAARYHYYYDADYCPYY